jgi:hypothetical protein
MKTGFQFLPLFEDSVRAPSLGFPDALDVFARDTVCSKTPSPQGNTRKTFTDK